MQARLHGEFSEADRQGYLRARPVAVPSAPLPAGLHALGLERGRDAQLFIPVGLPPELPAPFAVVLHGAGQNGGNSLGAWRELAERAGVILLASDSRGYTWDVLLGGIGPDARFLDRALVAAFDRCAVDPTHLAIEGFSDGASYALSLGVGNGELFTHIIANSPGLMRPESLIGRPRIYMSHGKNDRILPIENCSRRLAPALRSAGYDVTYEEFEGGHRLPSDVAARCFDWWLSDQDSGLRTQDSPGGGGGP